MNHPSLILLVDDQPRGLHALASLLEPEGYRLAFASNGQEAIVAATQLRPDLVLLDVMMPGMNGFEVCRSIRAEPRTAEVPVMMVTALDDQESLLNGIEAGADDFVTKPFNRTELRARVRTITRLNRYRRLWEQRERYARLVEHSPAGLLIVDAAGAIRLANPAMHQLLQAPPGHLLGRPLLEQIAPERRAALAGGLAALADGGAATLRLETAMINGAGGRQPVELAAAPCEWDTGPAIQVLVHDTTDRKRAELLDIERRHIAYELHDGVAQQVTGLYQHIQLYARAYPPRSPAARGALEQLQSAARQAAGEIRRVLEGLRPSALDDFGLASALGMLVDALREDGWELSYTAQPNPWRLPAPVETALFRIAQEALTNAGKYAGTRRAAICLEQAADHVRLEVRDWGVGFDPADQADPPSIGRRLGLRAMRERAALLGGELQVVAAPGQGVAIIASFPLPTSPHDGAADAD